MLALSRAPTALLLVLLSSCACSSSSAFTTSQQQQAVTFGKTSSSRHHSSSQLFAEAATANSLVVISPPGGVGQVTAVKAAAMGSAVRWFVVGLEKQQNQVVLAQEALDLVTAAGGSVQVAGADVASLLLAADDPDTAVNAVKTWCGAADSLVCTFDGVELASGAAPPKDLENPLQAWKDAIMVAAQESSSAVTGQKFAILSAAEAVSAVEEQEEAGGGIGGLVSSLFGQKSAIPVSLPAAMAADAASVVLVRHGELFGTPESSPDFSPLVGGPRKEAELCQEYATRMIRVDPTLSMSGNLMMGSTTRSSRHAVGEAAALMALQKVPVAAGLDICVSSLAGTDPVTTEMWQTELERCNQKISSGQDAQLFSADFGSVPDTERLADWLSSKWATAVLRTYDIAAIRIGARPVYANRPTTGTVEIVWQELVKMETVTVGKMVISVTDKGLIATRAAGDAAKGYGTISRKPLNGEDVLVRRLAEAVSQAVEKGLANKPKVAAAKKAAPAPEPVVAAVAAPVSSIQSSGTVEGSNSKSGPRQAGARRSKERTRGTRRKASPPKEEKEE